MMFLARCLINRSQEKLYIYSTLAFGNSQFLVEEGQGGILTAVIRTRVHSPPPPWQAPEQIKYV
jgi:hypothetical protein